MNRRELLGGMVFQLLVQRSSPPLAMARAPNSPLAGEKLPPVRAITRGPKFHWFSYYDKLQFDLTGRYVLGMEVDFENRLLRPDDTIKIGMIDLGANDRWIELDETRAWCWQQGCMLQWLPGSKTEVIFNDRQGDHYVSHILDVTTRKKRTLPMPIYAVSPDARWAVAPSFSRLFDVRWDYGYAGVPDPDKNVMAPEDSGIWRLDLHTGEIELLLSIADVARIPNSHVDSTGAKHYFIHLLFSPDGNRFIFLHRATGGTLGERTKGRMLTANLKGKDLRIVDDYGGISHFIWRDSRYILGWAIRPPLGGHFYLYEDATDKVEIVGNGIMTEDGHCTYLPDTRWILCDTYPDKQRNQNPYLFDTATSTRYALGHFHSPVEYVNEWRCDTHPRHSRDGRFVTIDSTHGGNGRQIYLINVSGIVG